MIQFETLDNGKAKVIITEDLASVLKSYEIIVRNFGNIYETLLESDELKYNADKRDIEEFHHSYFDMNNYVSKIVGECVCGELLSVEGV